MIKFFRNTKRSCLAESRNVMSSGVEECQVERSRGMSGRAEPRPQ